MNSQHVLFIGLVWPESKSSAAGWRMLQLIDTFSQKNYNITFASAAATSEWSDDLRAYNAQCETIQLNDDSFNIWITELQPSIIVYDRFITEEQYGWRVREFCPQAMTILDTEDLHFLRNARAKSIKKGQQSTTDFFYSDVTKREIASILRCDLSLIISEIEMNILQNDFRIDSNLLLYLPFLENKITPEITEKWIPFKDRSNFVFIGNYLHEPNYDAVLQLKTQIWPILKNKIPTATMNIYGAYVSQKVQQLHNDKDRFLVLNRAENARETIAKHKVLLAPITFGAGVKGKFIDAMQTGTPSITTSIGAEAMNGNLEWNGSITNDWNTFIEKAVVLYNEKLEWIEAQNNGIAIINSNYDKTQFVTPFLNRIEEILSNLNAYRNNNFMGQLLHYHAFQSTKYMSRWINEKNKNKL
jgi:glycosyltransferase involved in cell wall biosynthesis